MERQTTHIPLKERKFRNSEHFHKTPNPTWTYVDIYTCEAVIFQMARCSAPGHFQIQLYCVHAVYCMAKIAEHVTG